MILKFMKETRPSTASVWLLTWFIITIPYSADAFTIPRRSCHSWPISTTSFMVAEPSQEFNAASSPTVAVSPGILGPPEPLASLPVGSTLMAFRQIHSTIQPQQHDFEIERIAIDPSIFLLRNVLTNDECDSLMSDDSVPSTMAPAETVTPGDTTSRSRCQVAWLGNAWTQSLARSLGNLFLSTTVKEHAMSGVEDLQLLHYKPGGEFVLHHDGAPRVLTILYYVNGVGETWFPLADDTRYQMKPRNKQDALDHCQGLFPATYAAGLTVGGDGETIPIHRGDAVAFYNYLDDGSGELNWKSLHAGLPVQGGTDKWVANHWFRYGGFAQDE